MLVIIVAIFVSYYYLFQAPAQRSKENQPSSGIESGIGVDVGIDVEVGEGLENPLGDMPSANPLKDVVNPFEDTYKNPFE